MSSWSAEQLAETIRDGGLSVSDLAVWFDRPYPTVRGWVAGVEPWIVQRTHAVRRLHALQKLIKRGTFPMPARLSPAQRRDYVIRTRDAYFPATRAAE